MKTIYPLKSKPKSKFSGKVIVVLVLFFFLSLTQYFFNSPVKDLFYFISKPVWSVSGVVFKPFGIITNFFKNKNSLADENIILKDNLTKLELKSYDYDALQKENDYLKDQLGRADDKQKIIVAIVSKPPHSPYDTFVVDAGENDGIVVGSKVYLSEKIVVGIVKSAEANTSLVELFSTKSKNTDLVNERTGNTYTLVGQGGGNYKLEVPKDADVEWGDNFIYPNINTGVVGTAYYIDTNSQSAYKTVYIRVPVNVFSYRTLLIDKSSE
jgi:cell shape-determining protein MreC